MADGETTDGGVVGRAGATRVAVLVAALVALVPVPRAFADPSDPPIAPATSGPSEVTPTADPSNPAVSDPPAPTPSASDTPTSPVTPIASATPTDVPGTSSPTPSSTDPTGPPEPSVTPQPAIGWTAPSALAARNTTARATARATAVPVTVRTVCGGAIFANADRRDAVVGWGDFDRGAPDDSVTVAAGRAVTVKVSGREFDWAARWSETGQVGEAGRGDSVPLPTGCPDAEPAAALTAVVSAPCLARRQPVTVLTTGRVPSGTRWRVAAADNPLILDDGPLEAGRPLSVDLSRSGAGRYVLSLIRGDRVLDATTFSVQDCVTVQLSCHVADWTNPSGNTTVTVAFRTGAAAGGAVRLAPGASTRLSVPDGLTWSATATAVGGSLLSDAGSDVVHRYADGDCDDPPAAAVAAPAASAGEVAAAPATAAPAGSTSRSAPWLAVAALAAGVAAAVITGAAFWRRRRAQ